MNCAQARERISAAMLGALRGAERENLEAHCVHCADCRDEYECACETLAQLAAGPTLPRGLLQRVQASGQAELALERNRRLRWRSLAVRAAMLAVAAALFLVFSGGRSPLAPPSDTQVLVQSPVEYAPGASSQWCFVAGDSGNSRHIDTSTLQVPNQILWEQLVGGEAGAYKPLVWEDSILVGVLPASKQKVGGSLVAYSAADGQQRWRRDFTSGDFFKARNFPDRCIHSNRLYVTDGTQCLVLDTATGRVDSSFDPPAPAQGWRYLAAQGSSLFGVSRDGRTVFCVDAGTGAARWQYATAAPTHLPALHAGRLILHTRTGTVLALHAGTGEELWRQEHPALTAEASVHAHGDGVLVVSERDEILALRAANGERLWSRRLPGAFASGLALGDQAVYLLGGSVACSLADGKTIWRQAGLLKGLCSAPTLAGERVLTSAGNRFGSLNVLAASGEVLGAMAEAAKWACEGAVIGGGRIFTIGGGRLMALGHARN